MQPFSLGSTSVDEELLKHQTRQVVHREVGGVDWHARSSAPAAVLEAVGGTELRTGSLICALG